MTDYVYVQDMSGKPLMPTTRYGKVRRMLRDGQAKAVQTKPFTIRLTYQPETSVTQNIVAGMDPGRTNIGLSVIREDGTCLYLAKAITRNKEIPKLMQNRRAHRMASRRGERKARKRLAKKLSTTMKGLLERKLPGYKDGVVQVKDIINTESRFNNRNRPAGWLTPTARQLLQTHLHLFEQLEKLLPVTDWVIELNKFAFMAMDNPGAKRIDYQHGPLYGFGSVHDAVNAMQEHKCLYCRKPGIEHYHHIVPRSRGGSDTIGNLVGLHEKCHELIHKDTKAREKLEKKVNGLHKKYGALSVLNQIIPFLMKKLGELHPDHVFATNGWNTKQFREDHHLKKDHDLDAYCIGASILKKPCVEVNCSSYTIMQFRRHDRAIIKAQKERYYLLDGKKVAMNRNARIEQANSQKPKKQKLPPLTEWFEKMAKQHGQKEAERMRSVLTVQKSQRSYNNIKRHLPGTVFLYQGKRYVMRGQQNNGTLVYGYNGIKGKTPLFPVDKVTFLSVAGLQYL